MIQDIAVYIFGEIRVDRGRKNKFVHAELTFLRKALRMDESCP
jgi:hypothetical protein